MDQVQFHDVLSVDSSQLFSTITHYEDYPQFVDGCESVQLEKRSDGKIRVSYEVIVMGQRVNYVLDHQENSELGRVEWALVESRFFKKNTGSWKVESVGHQKSDVIYSLELEFKVPVPSFILNRLVKRNLPRLVKSFEKQAKQVRVNFEDSCLGN